MLNLRFLGYVRNVEMSINSVNTAFNRLLNVGINPAMWYEDMV